MLKNVGSVSSPPVREAAWLDIVNPICSGKAGYVERSEYVFFHVVRNVVAAQRFSFIPFCSLCEKLSGEIKEKLDSKEILISCHFIVLTGCNISCSFSFIN